MDNFSGAWRRAGSLNDFFQMSYGFYLPAAVVTLSNAVLFFRSGKRSGRSWLRSGGLYLASAMAFVALTFAAGFLYSFAAVREPLPAWAEPVEKAMRAAATLLPVRRITLAGLYALPLLLAPLVLAAVRCPASTAILLHAAVASLTFFWLHVVLEIALQSSTPQLAGQGLTVAITYFFLASLVFRFPLEYEAWFKLA